MDQKTRTFSLVALSVLALDFGTKWWIRQNVSPFDPIEVIEGFFRITHAANPGMAFGMLQSVNAWFFIVLTIVAVGMILWFLYGLTPEDRYGAWALGLILGGALGNLIDRVARGAVVDFLQFDFGLFIFPDFNVADSAIVIGVGLLFLELMVPVQDPDKTPGP